MRPERYLLLLWYSQCGALYSVPYFQHSHLSPIYIQDQRHPSYPGL